MGHGRTILPVVLAAALALTFASAGRADAAALSASDSGWCRYAGPYVRVLGWCAVPAERIDAASNAAYVVLAEAPAATPLQFANPAALPAYAAPLEASSLSAEEIEYRITERLRQYSKGFFAVLKSGSAGKYSDDDIARVLSIARRSAENARDDASEDASAVREMVTNLESGGSFAAASFTGGTDFSGGLYIEDGAPTATDNRLYALGGDLYWNGSVLGSSSAGVWSSASGNVYRATGNVGIGTSSPSKALTVSGNALFAGGTGTTTVEHALSVAGRVALGTTTGEVLDMGGAVCNVRAYGAVGDNQSDNHAAIMAAINDCPEGGTVLFPMGVFRVSQPVVLDKPVTLLGTYAPRWYYASTPRSSIKPTTSFTGSAIVHVRDKSISGQAADNNGGRIRNISIDGNSFGTDVDGVYFEGLVRDWKVEDVDISQTSGNALRTAQGAGSGNPRGFTIRQVSIYSPNLHGMRATALTDSYLEDILVVGGAQRGFYFTSIGETKLVSSRAVFNALEGLYIDGSSSNGGFQITEFSTDRNDRHGVRINASGTTSISFTGLLLRRDGANDGGGTETPYAGFSVIGSSSAPAAPVIVSNLTMIPGVDDDGLGTPSPSVGVRVQNARYVSIDGVIWGVDQAYVDGGGNGEFLLAEDTLLKTGYAAVTEELYNRKWVGTSTNVHYAGAVGIGTTSPNAKLTLVGTDPASAVLSIAGTSSLTGDYVRIKSSADQTVGNIFTIDSTGAVGIGTTTMNRMLNIAGAASPGFRFTDTTNLASFDMRVEDTQAFLGTMSSHDLRFITGGTSRAALTTSGRFGIGTTSPWRTLSASGTVAFFGLTVAGSSGDALCMGSGGEVIVNTGAQTCTVSSERFKHSIAEFTPEEAAALAQKLQAVTFEYNGTNEARLGLIAEEVAQIDERLIFTETDGTPRGVRYEDLTAVLLGALQHQQSQIAQLVGSTTAAIGGALAATYDAVFATTITVENLSAARIEASAQVKAPQLCAGEVCVTEAELAALLEHAGLAARPREEPATTSPEAMPVPAIEAEPEPAPSNAPGMVELHDQNNMPLEAVPGDAVPVGQNPAAGS